MDLGWMKSVDNLNQSNQQSKAIQRQHVFQSDKALLLFVKLYISMVSLQKL